MEDFKIVLSFANLKELKKIRAIIDRMIKCKEEQLNLIKTVLNG